MANEGGEGSEAHGSPQDEPQTTTWETPPKHIKDVSKVPVGKLQDHWQKYGTRVDMKDPTPDGKIPADVTHVALEGVPKKPWWKFW